MSDTSDMHYCDKCQRETPHFGYYADNDLASDTVEVECAECGHEQTWRRSNAPWWAIEMAEEGGEK